MQEQGLPRDSIGKVIGRKGDRCQPVLSTRYCNRASTLITEDSVGSPSFEQPPFPTCVGKSKCWDLIAIADRKDLRRIYTEICFLTPARLTGIRNRDRGSVHTIGCAQILRPGIGSDKPEPTREPFRHLDLKRVIPIVA